MTLNQSCLNEELKNISKFKWLSANKLTLNMTKTDFMLVGSRQKPSTLTASEHQWYSRKPLWVYLSMQTLPGAATSRSRLKKLPLVLQLSNGSGNLFPGPATLYLQALIQPHFDYWRNGGIKLADKNFKIVQ